MKQADDFLELKDNNKSDYNPALVKNLSLEHKSLIKPEHPIKEEIQKCKRIKTCQGLENSNCGYCLQYQDASEINKKISPFLYGNFAGISKYNIPGGPNKSQPSCRKEDWHTTVDG